MIQKINIMLQITSFSKRQSFSMKENIAGNKEVFGKKRDDSLSKRWKNQEKMLGSLVQKAGPHMSRGAPRAAPAGGAVHPQLL